MVEQIDGSDLFVYALYGMVLVMTAWDVISTVWRWSRKPWSMSSDEEAPAIVMEETIKNATKGGLEEVGGMVLVDEEPGRDREPAKQVENDDTTQEDDSDSVILVGVRPGTLSPPQPSTKQDDDAAASKSSPDPAPASTHRMSTRGAAARGRKKSKRKAVPTTRTPHDRPTKRVAAVDAVSPDLVPSSLEFEGRETPSPRKRPRYVNMS